jgi:predicted metalloprotease with PDZ domain
VFGLVADVQIRERTQNRKGLQDSLRAILDHGGDITKDWDIERAFAIGDQATGTDVLRDLYTEMADKPNPTDLGSLWQKLGLALNNGEVAFKDDAADAPIRKAIVAVR